MYLKRMELQGFKSFADRTVLDFKPGITAVIGPNGSGKSNISDAIRWVLGEQSMKSLRGAKSEDIIFAGTQARKSLGFAEVSIVIDNSDGKLPIEYTEVTVTRKIYRSGETGYFINKTPCRLKDILELFMDTGIGKDGYSIIGQGKIDEILSNKSEDRRHIFEEAAGIVKYRVRKQDSEKKLEQTKLNLLRINDILSEIETSIEPLQEQAEKARKYLDLREELKSIEVGLFVHNINVDKEKLEQIIKDVQILNEQNNNESLKMEKFQEEKSAIKQRIDEIIQLIEEKQNLGFESSNKIEKINSEIGISKERIQNNQVNEQRLEKEIEAANAKISELEEEKKQKLNKKESLNTNKEKYVKELEEKEKELAELSGKLTEKEKEIEDKKQIVESNTDKRYELTSDINVEKQNYENLEKRERTVSLEVQDTISELDLKRDEKQQLSQGFYELEDKRNKSNENLQNMIKQKETAMQKVKDFDDEINKLAYEIRMKDSRHKFLIETEKEKEGYIKSVRSLLLDCDKNAELKKGMHGILANLINVPKDYEIAIEMALGQSLQNIVTQTEEDAKKLVKHLRDNNLGRASFLPVTSVRGKKIDKVVTNGINGVVGIASDLVKYDKKYEQIVYNLLGRTVIVDSMETGISLSKLNNYTFRVVTTKGDIINPSGAITGGSITQKTVNILGRSREIEDLAKEIEQLQNIEPKKTTVTPNYSQPVYQENKIEPQRKSKNSFNKTFIMGLIFILVLGFGVGAFLSYGDFWSSKTVEVPNVVGMSQAQAEETLKAENLRVEVAETFDESVPVGKVASQTPEAGKTVKESRLVTIYISKGGEEINMINLVGLSQSEAENQLAKLKLKIGQVTAEYSDKPSGTVLKQSISANNKVKKGANIDIVVSKGKEVKKVSVPNVVGQSVDSARATLEAQGFNVSASASSGSVTAQSVSAGSQVETGTTIELTVSSGSADRHENSTNTNVPDKNEQTNTTNTGTTNTTTPEKPAIEVPQRQRD